MEDEFKTFINYLVEITSFLNKNHRVEVEDKIKQMEEWYLFQRKKNSFGEPLSPIEPNPRSAVIEGRLNLLIIFLRKLNEDPQSGPTIEEVDNW